jgi:hypothetical protein
MFKLISSFENFLLKDFADWLEKRMIDFHTAEPKQKYALLNWGEGINQWDGLVDALAGLYWQLCAPQQLLFRTAIGLVISRAKKDSFPANAMSDLILLIGRIHAHETLSPLVATIEVEHGWGESLPGIFFHTIAVMKTFENNGEVHQSARRLVQCKGFPGHFIFDLYQVLLANNQDEWANDLLFLTPWLDSYIKWRPPVLNPVNSPGFVSWFESRMKILVENYFCNFDISTIAKNMVIFEKNPILIDENSAGGILLQMLYQRSDPLKLYLNLGGDNAFYRQAHESGIESANSLPTIRLFFMNHECASIIERENTASKALGDLDLPALNGFIQQRGFANFTSLDKEGIV